MPPRVAKKSSGGPPGPQKAAAAAAVRASKSVPKAEVKIKLEEVPMEEAVKVKPVVLKSEEKRVEMKSKASGSVVIKEEEDAKKACKEDNGEQLKLVDNVPHFELEEDGVEYYDEGGMEGYDQEEEGGGGEDDGEEGRVGEEEEGAVVYEELEDIGEDVDGEEDEESAEEECEIDGEEEHNEVVKEDCKHKEFEVFVGGLDKDVTEEDLRKVFGEVGEITEVRLMMNPQTNKNKGFAFLRFATAEQAKRAISELKHAVVKGKECGVAPSHSNDTLFLGNICKTWTKEHLKEKLKSYGVENIEDLTLVEDTNNEGMNRGFAFLEFSSRLEAINAFRRLQRRDVILGVDRSAKVAFADSFIDPDDEIMSQVKTVFVDGLPAAWDEDRVKSYLKKYGNIEKIELARNMQAAKRKDFGFVTFDIHDHAAACAEAINNAEFCDGDKKVKVRARLSRPLQKSRVKHGARGDFRVGRRAPQVSNMSHGPPPRRFPGHVTRVNRDRGALVSDRGFKRPVGITERRPTIPLATRRLPPTDRSYDKRPPVRAYPKNSSGRDFIRHDELPPLRSRVAANHGSRVPFERQPSYRDEYSFRVSDYSYVEPQSPPHIVERRAYADARYDRKLERPLPTYREGRSRDCNAVPRSKRPYSEVDDAPRRYADASVRLSRTHLGYGNADAQYDGAYDEGRLEHSHIGYSSSHSQDRQYTSRRDMSYSGGSLSGSNVGRVYPSSYSTSYMPRGSDVGHSSYSPRYSGRRLNDSGYSGGSGSSSYY